MPGRIVPAFRLTGTGPHEQSMETESAAKAAFLDASS
jgi:hypothetical protein